SRTEEMATLPLQAAFRQLRYRAGPTAAGPSDAQLLDRYTTARDEGAFELLLWRHGGMGLSLCRRILRHEQDAEDAFQATFLTVARKGHVAGRRGSVGGWLHAVAVRAALAAKERAARRPSALPEDVPGRPCAESADRADLRRIVDDEIGRLPDRYRAVV